MASAATKVGPKFQVTIPKSVRHAVGLKVGDLVEASVGRDGIALRQKVLIDKPVSLARQLEESEAAVKVVKIGATVVAHGRYLVFQMAEVAVPRELFGGILARIARLRPPDPAPC
jgi:AbrB family looped-hinge helix DNA binding protein